jgi:glycosyltransferase involved in cell wall biosynthesis
MVFEVRDLWPEMPIAMGALNFPFAKPAARWLEKWAYSNSARVVALSPGMAQGVERTGFPADRIHCIPNSSDIELFETHAESGQRFRQSRPWLLDRPLLIYAGTFGRVNGLSYLVDLAQAMAGINPEFRFLVVGKGAEEELVRSRAHTAGVLDQNLFIEPPMPKAELPEVFSAATICSSLFIPLKEMWHNSANKFFDSLAAGRPLAINYGGWQAEILEETGAGIQLDPFDAHGSALRLQAFVSDDARQKAARTAASALAHNRFARDRLARDLIALLEQVHHEHSTGKPAA